METITADKEESLLRGYLPLNKEFLELLQSGKKIETISFPGNGYLTDALLHLIKRKCTSQTVFSDLNKIDLIGCNFITDYGIRSLLQSIGNVDNLKEIDLGGCEKLTDSTAALLLEVTKGKTIQCSLKCTAVACLNHASTIMDTKGCPDLHTSGTMQNDLQGLVLVVPEPCLKQSVGEYLHAGACVERKSGYYKTGLAVNDWDMSIMELSSNSCLFDSVNSTGLTQVVIPFDASSEPKDIKSHVLSTISKVVAKEPVQCKFPDSKPIVLSSTNSDMPFMDIHKLDKQSLTENDSGQFKLRNVSKSESSIGMYASRAPFTRSNSYFEIECSINEVSADKTAVLVGCLYDMLFSLRHPMDSTSDSGGYVDGFEITKKNMVIGFGIEGEWLSEYVPGDDCKYYFVEDGVKKTGKVENTKFDHPHAGMYPLVSILGETFIDAKLPPLVAPPKETKDKWQRENRWIEKGHSFNMMCDKHGRLRYLDYYNAIGQEGLFLGMHEFTSANKMFSIQLVKLAVTNGKKTSFKVGIAMETHNDKAKKDMCMILSVTIEPFLDNWVCGKCKYENKGHSKSCENCISADIPKKITPTNWACSGCQFENPLHVDTCTSCKKVQKPEGFGKPRLEICTEMNGLANTRMVVTLDEIKEGDIITVKTSGVPQDGVYDVQFDLSGKQIAKRNFPFADQHCRVVPMVRMSSPDDLIVLRNFRPTYRRPAPYKNKVTVGRAHLLRVMDNGDTEYYNYDKGATTKSYGLFVAKTPFNKELLEFEVEVAVALDKWLLGIGVCPPDYTGITNFLGWQQGSVAYHADNGFMYASTSQGSKVNQKIDDIMMKEGDKLTVKVVPVDDKTPLVFDDEDNLDSNQTVKLLFLKNDILVYEIMHEIVGEGLYPAFSSSNATIRIKNFYSETKDVWDALEREKNVSKMNEIEKKKKKKKDEKQAMALYSGTEFLVVGVKSGASDPKGKLQIIEQQLNFSDWEQLHNVTSAITDMEKNLTTMDLQEQLIYADLCAVEDNMKLLVQNPKRIKYHTVDLNSDKEKEILLDELEVTQKRHQAFQPAHYQLTTLSCKWRDIILKELSVSKVMQFSQIFREIPDLAEAEGHTLMALLKEMQFKGKLLLLDIGSDVIVVDIACMLSLEEKLSQLLPTKMVNIKTTVTSIGQSSHVWDKEAIFTKLLADIPKDKEDKQNAPTEGGDTSCNKLALLKKKVSKVEIMRDLLEKVFALISLQCLRTSPEDDLYIYVIQQNISNPPAPMTNYWNSSRDKKNFVVISQTYNFPFMLPEYILPQMISNTSKYGRVVILTGEGIVYQNGAVQTVIIKHQDKNGKNCIVIESSCYMPDISGDEDTKISKQTVSYVQDYTWNVFCIFTDVIDDLLKRSNVVVIISKDVPFGMVNVSVGCKHAWVRQVNKIGQSVCTLCNRCCDKGGNCHWNAIMGTYLRECGCQTEIIGCKQCGICISCANELWNIRSRLRPFGLKMTQVAKTITEKTKKIKPDTTGTDDPDGQKEEDAQTRNPVQQPVIPLDPFVYSEVEFTNLTADHKLLCLREESDGTIMQAFPGKAMYVQDLAKVSTTTVYDQQYKLNNGDQIKVKLSDPLEAYCVRKEEASTKEEALSVEPVYFALQGREVKVIHETGIVMYDTASTAIPVGQFIGCRPLTKECPEFSVKVLSTGASGTLAIGLVPKDYPPNRQPGWNKQAIGFHADDGGIFLESGAATRKTQICKEGDVMSFHIDFERKKGFFRKNGLKMIELNLNPSRLGFYPCIGFHSLGEAVQIMEKAPWAPQSEEERNLEPPALPTYKYGNLWISPGKRVTLTKVKQKYHGWIALHNPKKDPIGFKVKSGNRTVDNHFGVIEHKKDWLHNFAYPQKDLLPELIMVEWLSLESGRSYTTDEMKVLFGDTEEKTQQSSHQHRLTVAIVESSQVMEELPTLTVTKVPATPMLCLQVFRNLKLVDEYWLKYGSYHMTVETFNKKSRFVLKYPKCPSFHYSRVFQKGMKLSVYLDNMQAFAECIIVEVYNGGKMLALEYSPKDKADNTTICVMANSPALMYTEFQGNDATMLPYEPRSTPQNLTNTFVFAPPYLLSEGGRKVLNFIDREWKAQVLRSMSSCLTVFTRLTVQERHIRHAATRPLEWMNASGSTNYLFTMLPQQLSISSLMYPQGATMFTDVGVHRLCFSTDELFMQQGLESHVAWKLPLHFVDIPGIVPNQSLPLEASYCNGWNIWTYISLISNRLYLPSYQNMIQGDTSMLSRGQVEQLLYNTLQLYAALCGIYSAPLGGVEGVQNDDPMEMKEFIRHADDHITKFSGQPHTETDMLFKRAGRAMCKAHCLNIGVSDTNFPEEIKFDYRYFEPYTDVVSMFYWCQSKLSKLPDDFFKKFRNLQYFRIGLTEQMMHDFTSLPSGIGDLTSLKVIEMTNTAMTKLPDDIFMSSSAVTISCTNMPIKTLPSKWRKDSKLTELILAGLHLKEIPEEIGNFEELLHLELCYNPITDLPEAMSKLQKLNILKLIGIPWLTFAGKRSQITHDQYHGWHHTNPFVEYNIGKEKIEDLFTEFDVNHNGSLDEEELAHLNLYMFFNIPRLGLKDINDEVTGGIPAVVFSLSNLNELYLDYNSITTVPQAINNLQNLNTLSLNHNPLLESLPGILGHLPNIKGIQIQSCPMLRTPPTEVVSRGFESVKAYLKRLAGGFTECRRTKLMVVGLGGAGKTSLLRALMSENKMTLGTEAEIPTDGIDIVPWTVTADDGQTVTYSTWDFAGQAVYYNTHQFFLSKRAVYLLLWSMRQGYEHAGLDFWLSSICCHAPGTPILVIGTQCDLIPKAEIPEKLLMERYPQIAGFHRVSSVKGIGITELQKNLLDVTLQEGYMGEKIPQVWLNFEKRIIAERLTKKSYIKWDVARQYAMEQGIYDEKDVRLAIQLLHDLGTVQYFDNDFLRDYVVINPQWIVNVMACVVSAQDSPIQKNKGRFLHSDIPLVWKDYDPNLHRWLLRLTEDFDLTFPLPKEPVNVVPCLLPGEEPEDLNWPKIQHNKGIRESKMVYRFTYLPSGLFNRAQVRLFQFSDGKKVWKKGSLLSKNKHLALIKQSDNTELVVFVQGPRPENIMFLIHEVFESIIEESFNGVSYDLYVPCPDCIMKEGTSDPDLLNAKLIQRAKDLKAPFLQCYKYFHWISMAQLQEKLPADSREVSDFDIQLQQSVVALQELNNDLVVDCAIIYSSADVPQAGDTTKLAPSLIRDDVKSWGYSCWFANDMDNVSYVDLTAAIKNCKILLALISDDFERDTKCRDMFLYAKEAMNKEIVVVVLGQSLDWQNKDLGMKIGNQERLLMAKTLNRYVVEGGRRAELKEWLEEKIHQLSNVTILPDIFLSYSWSNSKNACDKSGRTIPGAIGWADPRYLKTILHEEGLNTWIDIENVGKEKKGIFADMAAGIRNSKVMLACISDEYAESDNCMMELRFGILNMKLPLVVAIVGTGTNWKETEVAMLLRRAKAPEVYIQKENPEGFNALIKYVKDSLMNEILSGDGKKKEVKATMEAKDALKGDKSEKSEKKDEEQSSSIAYQEEYELIQRKFMRHITQIGSLDSMALPRLIVVDFVKSVQHRPTENALGRESREGHPKPKKMLRPKTATKSRDRLQIDDSVFEDDDVEDWSRESFCIKLLCEHEEGWHLCTEMYPLAFRTREQLEIFMKKVAPYLYRIYTILKQSPIKLKCFTGGKGDAYQTWIRDESDESLDFVGALMHLWEELAKDEATEFVNYLARCRLPSGKIVWLCQEHQGLQHVAKLSTSSSGGSYNLLKVLFNEDKLLMEYMEKHEDYKKLKGIKSTKVAPKLPNPIPLPSFSVPTPTVSSPEEKRDSSPVPPPQKDPPPPTPPPEEKKRELPPIPPSTGKEDVKDEEVKTTKAELVKDTCEQNSNRADSQPEDKVEGLVKKVEETVPKEIDAGTKSKENEKIKEMEEPVKEDLGRALKKRKESLKEYVTKSVIQPNSAINKLENAIQQTRKPNYSQTVSSKMFDINSGSMKTNLQRNPSSQNFQSIKKGSNVRKFSPKTESELSKPKRKSLHESLSSEAQSDLAMSLHVQTVKDTRTPGDSGGSNRSSGSNKGKATGKAKTEVDHPLEKVRPRKIKVQPQSSGETADGLRKKPSIKATGRTVGVTSMALPEHSSSKACVLQ